MDPLDILDLLRSALSLGSMIVELSQRHNVRRGARDAMPQIIPRHRALLTSDEGLELLGTLVIDEALLNDLIAQIEDAQQRYRRALLTAETPEARRAADIQAEQEICEHLTRIKVRNGGTLPLRPLRSVWLSYGCAEVSPHVRLLPEATSE